MLCEPGAAMYRLFHFIFHLLLKHITVVLYSLSFCPLFEFINVVLEILCIGIFLALIKSKSKFNITILDKYTRGIVK